VITFDARRRSELAQRIAGARVCLAYANRCKSDLAKQTDMLQKKKAQLSRFSPFAKAALVAEASESITLAEKTMVAAVEHTEAARVSAVEVLGVLLAMQAELDEPISEGAV